MTTVEITTRDGEWLVGRVVTADAHNITIEDPSVLTIAGNVPQYIVAWRDIAILRSVK